MTDNASGIESVHENSSLRFLPVVFATLAFYSSLSASLPCSDVNWTHSLASSSERPLGSSLGRRALLGSGHEPLQQERVHLECLLVRTIRSMVVGIVVLGRRLYLVEETWEMGSQ
jgi:hypothetical protein